MDRHLVTTIWIGGAALALLVFLIGPDNFLAAAAAVSDALDRMFHGLLSFFGAQAYNAIRAATIAVYAVFLVLAAMAFRAGQRAIAAAIVVSAGFVVLVWRPDSGFDVSATRWLIALTLCVIGAVTMTQRLIHPDQGKRGKRSDA